MRAELSRIAGLLGLLLAVLAAPHGARAEQLSLALVQDDASLSINGRTVRLYGILIPDGGRTCETRIRPVRCASRAALALELRIQGFVACDYLGRNPDGSRSAVCWARCNFGRAGCREDLGAWLIGQGWAVAAPGAPYSYVVQERIARHRNRGVWGFQADSITR